MYQSISDNHASYACMIVFFTPAVFREIFSPKGMVFWWSAPVNGFGIATNIWKETYSLKGFGRDECPRDNIIFGDSLAAFLGASKSLDRVNPSPACHRHVDNPAAAQSWPVAFPVQKRAWHGYKTVLLQPFCIEIHSG